MAPPPPLVGDAHGNYRVHIVGNSVGKGLADLLGVPFIPLDTLFWKPGWKQSTNDELRAKVEQALANAPNGWVVDGNYHSKIGTVVEDQSTDVICAFSSLPGCQNNTDAPALTGLDPPLALYLPRVIWRTFLRLLRLREPCSPGCSEMVSEVFFSRESIVWWCITQHRIVRERESARMAQIGIGIGSDVDKQKMRRIGGWGEELRAWFRDVKRMLQCE
ncbi:hypothetical protein MVEN_00258200 [Mycena venus]|uniref:Uncharacterized protein n=1 Tax=Mycena venus TaxID=2733690 RepID=A0A8H6YYB3_9AGAR|nr:hypothetical protein MVEN_00258200 [Mycena venus]